MKKRCCLPVFIPVITLFFLLSITYGCSQRENKKNDNGQNLFDGFVNPPSEARPFVRWWWNGNHINADEIKRELDILQSAGIGGVEINPIAMPEDAFDIGTKPVEWLSKEWNDLFASASAEAARRGMITDVIVGSGWPFGGEFLNEKETIQRVITNTIFCTEGQRVRLNEEDLIKKAEQALGARSGHEEAETSEVLFIHLVPENVSATEEIKDLTTQFKKNNIIDLAIPDGNYELSYGIRQRNHRKVVHGALGAAGPVMDHYKKNVTLSYLGRLKKISDDTGIPLKKLIRALFCDSIELAGANWTDGFRDIFYREYNYSIEPYLSFLFYDPHEGYEALKCSAGFADEIMRVRYDFNKLLVKTFLDNFTRTFQQFCTDNGLLCRYQAYGTPFLMGMMEGNMIPDIPESNNWIYSADMDSAQWVWNQEHGYMIWNLYAASGGHLTGKKIISCEAMTNTRGVFKTSLEEIKQHDDMNFITGINHSVLHGFNYSPPEAGFPGWVRYGAYFSEQNPWWPYFHKWVEYNARLSYIFQQTQPVKNIAILPPTGDLWAKKGLTRLPFHTEPWYCFRLWESLSQAGSSFEYISEKIIQESSFENGVLKYGPMSYQTLILCAIQSMEPETAKAIKNYIENGGYIIVIDSIPARSLSLADSKEGDEKIRNIFTLINEKYKDQFFFVESPSSQTGLLSWTIQMLDLSNIQKDVDIDLPNENVFQIRKKSGDKDIYFFTNTNRTETITLNTSFPVNKKTPWKWDPEKGTRYPYPIGKNNSLKITLNPLESLLLVFEPDRKGNPQEMGKTSNYNTLATLKGPWYVSFNHINGTTFNHTFEKLSQFGTSPDPKFGSFAGTVNYKTTFSSDGRGTLLELGQVNKGITEIFLNGKNVGVNWYGKPVFTIRDMLINGENTLEIKYTTVLSNYVRSLRDNPTAMKWASGHEQLRSGPEGEIKILEPKF
jgi:hypothetical protein